MARPFVRGVLVAAGLWLAACGGGSSSGPATINVWVFNEPSGSFKNAAKRCSAASHGQYKIKLNALSNNADQQRQSLVRRLAAKDSSIDIAGMDVVWTAEFAAAGWVKAWPTDLANQVKQGTLPGPLATATYQGKLYAAPANSNTQLLWYRKDKVNQVPKTWNDLIDEATKLKTHIEIQGAQYEGVVVWFNTLVASAGGSILNEQATAPALGEPARKALQIMKRLASSPAADPSLSVQMEDQNRLAMEAGTAAFELNYPFVYPSMKTNKPALFKNFKWAQYPAVSAGEPSHVTIGGIDMAISKYSKHPDLAFEAALCLRDADNQKVAAVKGGLPPTLESLYSDPDLAQSYPFHEDILQALQNASVRPKTPAYQNISIVISHSISPPSKINPDKTESTIASQIKDALASKGLIP